MNVKRNMEGINMNNDWESIKERADMITRLDEEHNAYRYVQYRDIETGEVLDRVPKELSPFTKRDYGTCIECGRDIKEAVPDDRFCNKCYKTIFPDSVEEEHEV